MIFFQGDIRVSKEDETKAGNLLDFNLIELPAFLYVMIAV